MATKRRKPSKKGFQILLKYLFKYKREIVLLSFLGVISGFANATVPYIVGSFFDAILDVSKTVEYFDYTIPLWMGFVILFGIIQIFANVSDWVIDKRGKRIAILVHAEYLANATAHLLQLSVPFYKEHQTGEVWDKIRRASEAIHSLLNNVVISLAPQILSVIIGLGIAAYISPLLSSILIAGMILYVFTLFIILPPIVKLQEKGQEAWGKSYGYSFGAISNFQAVKQSGAELYERRKIWGKFVNITFNTWYKVQKIWSSINFYQRTIVLVTQIFIFVVAVGLIQKGDLTIGGLIALNGYAMMVFGPFIVLGKYWQIIQNGIVAIERAEKILLLPTEQYENGKENIDDKDFKGNVEFKNVFFAYKKNEPTVLKDISFKVNAGETIALVGESGVGKSTAMELVSGYYFPSKGKVLIDGYDTKETGLKSIRENIAIVPQEPVLFNDTVRHNIRYGSFKATDEEIKNVAREAHADIFIEQFPKKYNQVVGERGIRLSVGQKQRIAIARAMLRNPKILILDEPTSALDAKTEKFITESLERLMEDKTTFVIAHRLSTVRKADKILVFKAGKVVEEGKHVDLIKIKDGVYKYLYDYQVGLH
jgi:ABC-type multidrug transport system fused ATPase/permease subunit